VTQSTKKDVELHLLRKEAHLKAIGFALNGAFASTHPNTSKILSFLLEHCPTLMERFLPVSQRSFGDEGEEEQSGCGMNNQLKPRITNTISLDYIKRKRQPTKPRDDDDFANLLRESYQKDYNTPILHLGNQAFVFYTTLTYVDR
jgi:hypothetical protein